MIKQTLLFLLTLVYSLAAHANVKVTVEVPINSPYQQVVLQNAKTKAVQASLDRLPSIIWGEQSLSNSSFHEDIKAIGFAQADVTVDNETWDHANHMLKISATVMWDEQKVMSTLKEVQQGQQAKKTVKEIEKILNGLSAKDFLEGGAYTKQAEARLLASPFYLGMDMENYTKRYTETLNQMKEIKFQRVLEYADHIIIEPKGIQNDYLVYQIHFPDPQNLQLKFQSEDLQKFYSDNSEAIDGIALCAHTPYNMQKRLPKPLDLKPKFTKNFEIRILQKKYVHEAFAAGLKPIYFHPCEPSPT